MRAPAPLSPAFAAKLQQAIALHQRGQLEPAGRLYRELLSQAPSHVDVLHLLGIIELQRGNPAAAIDLFDRALTINPDNADAHSNRGNALRALGRHEDALKSYERAVALRSDFAEAFYNRATVLQALMRPDEALASYDRALVLKPGFAKALNNRGNTLRDLERYEEALASYERALSLEPDYAEALNNRGLALQALNRYEDALASYGRALAQKPDLAEALHNRGNALRELMRYEEAVASYERALSIRPGYVEALSNRGNALRELRRYEEAVASYDDALALRPDYADAFHNRGLALQDLKRHADALASFERALAFQPGLAEAHFNRGNALRHLNRYQDALDSYDRALALRPEYAEARFNRSLQALLLGDFEAGWEGYESRKFTNPMFKIRKWPYREWDGSPLSGQRMLIYQEQGLGDEIMFASCVPDLLAQGCESIVECSPKLERLFRRSFPAATVVAADKMSPDVSYLQSLPACDWQVAAGSLPRFLRRSWADFPRHEGYLVPDSERADYWRRRLSAIGGTRRTIGLSWRGGADRTDQSGRSVDLAQLLPLWQVPDTTFVSLQYTDCQEEIARFESLYGVKLHHWREAIDDYDETAALVAALDQVISVQTAVIHLGGALGKPVWVLVPATPEWRYMAEGERIPWYPTVRLFRQQRADAWEPLIADVAGELRRMPLRGRA